MQCHECAVHKPYTLDSCLRRNDKDHRFAEVPVIFLMEPLQNTFSSSTTHHRMAFRRQHQIPAFAGMTRNHRFAEVPNLYPEFRPYAKMKVDN